MERTAIEQLIPHRGQALWLDSVCDISEQHIAGLASAGCTAHYGKFAEPCLLFEAAAQLCAVHGAAKQTNGKVQAYVAKVQQLNVHSFAVAPGPLLVRCNLLSNNPVGALYHFTLHSAALPVLSGHLLVVIHHAAA